MASKLINKGKISIKKMNIHAGIVDEDIINWISNFFISIKISNLKTTFFRKNFMLIIWELG